MPETSPTAAEAVAAFRSGQLEKATELCERALSANSGDAIALHLLGSIAAHRDDDATALEYFNRVIQLEPDNASVLADRALLHERQGRPREAEADYRAALVLRPDFFEACHNLAVVLRRQERFDESFAHSLRTIELRPRSEMAQFHHALNCELVGDVEGALACYDRAVQLKPDFAEARANRALCKLLLGQFHDAWEDYAYRDSYRLEQLFPKHLFEQLQSIPAWDGGSLTGKRLLVYGDQGIGDEILFASIFTELIEQGCQLVVICDPRLQPLLARSFPTATILGHVLHSDQPIAGLPDNIDFHIPSGHLPRFLRLKTEDFADRATPYLFADPEQVAAWRARFDALGAGLKVGVSWRAGGGSKTRDRRTTQLADWAPLLQLPNVQVIDLQYGETEEERAALQRELGLTVHHFAEADPLTDMDGFAAKMSALDFVISVGNATVHTAGALGVETLALLPRVPIWRWMLHGERSIWYPSVAMVRQEQWYQWAPVLRQATDWLVDRLRQRGLIEPQQVHPVAAEQLSGSQTAPTVSPALHDPFRTAAPETLYEEAQRRHQQGDVAGAEELYLRLVKNAPLHADAWNLAGVAAHQQGRHSIALQRIGRAIEMHPEQPLFQFNLACVQTAGGLASEAIATYRKLCQLAPNMIEAPHNLGALLADRGELAEAIEAYDRALRIDPTCVIAHVKRGLALRELGRIDEARQAFEQALKLDPNCQPAAAALDQCRKPVAADRQPAAAVTKRRRTEAASHQIAPLLAQSIDLYHQERFDEALPIIAEILRIDSTELTALRLQGVIERRTGDPRRAIGTLQTALQLSPCEAALHFELGTAYRLAGELAPAYEHYCRASELDPSLQPAYLNAGAILEDWQRFDEALPLQETAVKLNPKCPDARYNLGNCRMKLGDAAAAIDDYNEVIRLEPGYTRAHWNRANANLLLGNFAAGFADFDYRYKSGEVDIDRYPQPRWRGEPLAGKSIVLHAEQGIGDEILFASCFAEVIEQARRVAIVCEPRLAPLFQRSFPAARVFGIARRRDFAPPELPETFDYQLPFGGLPGLLRRNEAVFPRRDSYLLVDHSQHRQWRERFAELGDGLKIGISWRTGGKPADRRKRTTQLAQWRALFELPGADWINLQYGDVEDDLLQASDQLGVTIHDFPAADPLIDMDGFAAKVAALDLVISVGNATVHLAGALGVEAWCLLPLVPSWRWMLQGARSPWYQSVSLFRQPRRGDWQPVFAQVQEQLGRRLNMTTEQTSKMNASPVAADGATTIQIDQEDDLVYAGEIPKLLARGISYHQSGKYSLAEETYRKILEHAPRHIDALQLLGTLASQTGRAALAIRSIRRALSVNNHNPMLHYNLANTLAAQGELDEAIRHYETALAQQSNFPEALLNLGVACGQRHDLARARECYEQALAARPGYIDAIKNLSLLERSA